jgi:hypothetical protein
MGAYQLEGVFTSAGIPRTFPRLNIFRDGGNLWKWYMNGLIILLTPTVYKIAGKESKEFGEGGIL